MGTNGLHNEGYVMDKPVFTDRKLSGKKSLAQLGITEADSQVPAEWKRVRKAKKDCDSELQSLFSPERVKAALKQALRKFAHR